MKKMVVAGLIAVSMMAVSQQQASAWVNSRFSVGLTWDFQSGGNQLLWGAWRNGQPPGPEAFSSGIYQPRYQGPMPGGFGPSGPGMYGPGFGVQPFFGNAPQNFAPMPQGFADTQSSIEPFTMPYSSPYQFANYPRPTYYYYGR